MHEVLFSWEMAALVVFAHRKHICEHQVDYLKPVLDLFALFSCQKCTGSLNELEISYIILKRNIPYDSFFYFFFSFWSSITFKGEAYRY